MLEAGVHGSGVHVVSPGELTDAAEPLEGGLVDDLPFPVVDGDEPMDRAAEFEGTVLIGHSGSPTFQ
jgi:hypothetical protein